MKKRIYALYSVVQLMLSCIAYVDEPVDTSVPCRKEIYPIKVEVELPQQAADSRSSYTDEDINRITDLNIFIYHDGLLLEEHSGYFADVSSLMLSFPYDKDGFNIYMFGNVGEIEAPEDESEIYAMRYVTPSYDDFKVKGFPIANVFPDHEKGTLAVFKLKRLIGQYDVTMQQSASDALYKIKDVRLLNCALDVYPFDTQGKATEFTKEGNYDDTPVGDVMTEEDIARLNDGETVSLYFVENLQGELLPGNTDRRKKIPSSLEAVYGGLPDCCTYIEITADVTTQGALYTDGKYRFYLGQNETTDFSIRRNTLYGITLDFTQNMVSEEEWRIEVGTPEVKPLVLSKEEADIVYGISDYILISGHKVTVSDESDSDELEYELSDVMVGGKEYQKLTLYTNREVTGFYDWNIDYRKIAIERNVILETVEKYNGRPLTTKTVTAHIYDKAFPVFLRMGTNNSSSPYQLEVVTNAPVNFELDLSAIVIADVESSGTVNTYAYKSSASVQSETSEGLKCCLARFSGLYNSLGTSSEKTVRFRRMDVTLSGKKNECCSITDFYMGDGGEAYWGPGDALAPRCFSDLVTSADIATNFVHSCSVAGCVRYEVSSGSSCLFRMAPKGRTCSSIYTTGTSNSLSYDVGQYSSGLYVPFYIVNGCLRYAAPVTLQNEAAKYLDDSARKSIVFELVGPGRDVFYPNGAVWGSSSENTPDPVHRFGYTAGLTKQFFGNIRTWQIYQDYECDFYMTVNGCTSWPGASTLYAGFNLTYSL